MVEYQKKQSSGVAKAALATGIGVGALGLINGALGGIVSPLGARAPFVGPSAFAADPTGGYVTDKEMCLIRENGAQGSIIARLEAEKYTDAVVVPLKNRICALETQAAVNAARDQDFRRYVEREFVHQPKAHMRECIVTTTPGCCECNCTEA